jgi:hypothetical protein
MLSLAARALVIGLVAVAPLDRCAPGRSDLNVSVAAHGSVVDGDNRSDWRCDAGPGSPTCTVAFSRGAVVTLKPQAWYGYHFAGWQGDCSGVGQCKVTMNGEHAVSAIFVAGAQGETVTLQEWIAGSGHLLDNREGRVCVPAGCEQKYVRGQEVVLRAQPNIGERFERWAEGCPETDWNVPYAPDCHISSLDKDTKVVAVFSAKNAPHAPAGPAPTPTPTPTPTAKGWGVADDTSKYAEDSGRRVYADLGTVGMTLNRWTLLWDGRSSDGSTDAAFLSRALAAKPAGIQIILSLYPDPNAFVKNADGTRQAPSADFVNGFAAWAGKVAERYRGRVDRFIVLNEPNLATFWPTTDRASTVEQTLAAAYDAIKVANPGATVAGLGLSGRAPSAASTAPIDLISQIGALYKSSGRAAPLFDTLALHPYPPQDKALTPTPAPTAPAASYSETKIFYGVSTLKRVKDAVNVAFAGTGQKTVAGGLKLLVDEYAYQVNMQGDPRYTNNETSSTVPDQKTQADDLVTGINRYLACDADISDVLLFRLVDEQDLGTWQSGLEEVDGTHRQSFDAVTAAIKQGCTAPGPTFP